MQRVSLILALMPLLVGGCRTAGYYCQAACGQWRLSQGQQSIQRLIDNPSQPDELRSQLKLVLAMREFASRELHLPPGNAYLKYKKLNREYPVWVVFASPELSTQLESWWYPFVGRAEVRSYFHKSSAEKFAAKLRLKGSDVYVAGAPAYSSLGWFADPVLSSFAFLPEVELADMIFHELAHRRYYLTGDSAYNESYATVIGEIGVRRWLINRGDETALQKYKKFLKLRDRMARANEKTLKTLNQVYADANLRAVDQREQKQIILKSHNDNFKKMGILISSPLNNASLAAMSMYRVHVPAFRQLFHEAENKLSKFFILINDLGRLPLEERDQKLDNLRHAYENAKSTK